ncbi:exopolysaccharide biosynthesis protein [Pseudaestuariivita sp.]|uniref:exopolysaccharide biosynthesis protein n=1 Tax=Pseudaestuariivita sp. TaxID=2211669 RepID=UPI0040587187
MTARTTDAPVRQTLNRVATMRDRPEVSVGDMVGAVGPTGPLPVLMLLGLVLVSPLSGVPLFSTLVGLVMVLTAGQMLIGRDRPRLPSPLAKRSVSGTRLGRALARLRGIAQRIDRVTTAGRLGVLTRPPVATLVLSLIVVIGLIMPVLEFVPFSSSIFGGAVALMALGLFVRDGLLVLAGLTVVAAATAIPVTVAVRLIG